MLNIKDMLNQWINKQIEFKKCSLPLHMGPNALKKKKTQKPNNYFIQTKIHTNVQSETVSIYWPKLDSKLFRLDTF